MYFHVEVTVRPLVLFEVFNPLVERPSDVFLRRPIKAQSIKPRYVLVGQLLRPALAGIFTRVPRFGAKLDEGSVLVNRHVGMAMRLLEPLHLLHSIVETKLNSILAYSGVFFCVLMQHRNRRKSNTHLV